MNILILLKEGKKKYSQIHRGLNFAAAAHRSYLYFVWLCISQTFVLHLYMVYGMSWWCSIWELMGVRILWQSQKFRGEWTTLKLKFSHFCSSMCLRQHTGSIWCLPMVLSLFHSHQILCLPLLDVLFFPLYLTAINFSRMFALLTPLTLTWTFHNSEWGHFREGFGYLKFSNIRFHWGEPKRVRPLVFSSICVDILKIFQLFTMLKK